MENIWLCSEWSSFSNICFRFLNCLLQHSTFRVSRTHLQWSPSRHRWCSSTMLCLRRHWRQAAGITSLFCFLTFYWNFFRFPVRINLSKMQYFTNSTNIQYSNIQNLYEINSLENSSGKSPLLHSISFVYIFHPVSNPEWQTHVKTRFWSSTWLERVYYPLCLCCVLL